MPGVKPNTHHDPHWKPSQGVLHCGSFFFQPSASAGKMRRAQTLLILFSGRPFERDYPCFQAYCKAYARIEGLASLDIAGTAATIRLDYWIKEQLWPK
jgi:hypothetical protein